jgi:hypothetical protein
MSLNGKLSLSYLFFPETIINLDLPPTFYFVNKNNEKNYFILSMYFHRTLQLVSREPLHKNHRCTRLKIPGSGFSNFCQNLWERGSMLFGQNLKWNTILGFIVFLLTRFFFYLAGGLYVIPPYPPHPLC